jgi:hypothetical protein
MPLIPPEYPAQRGWAFPQAADLPRYPALSAARERSCRLHAQMRDCLAALSRSAPEVLTIAVSGSLGRLEAGPHSDADPIVVLADDLPARADRAAVMNEVWDLLEPLSLPRPDPAGIFAGPITRAALCDPSSVGRIVEDPGVFGKRIQLLLDTQPIYGSQRYAELVRSIVERYAIGFVARDAGKEWAYLLNDLIRYFRALCVQAQWDFAPAGGGWYWRSSKLRHSRVLLYAGLLFLLGESSKERQDKVGWLTARLRLTPLERIASVYLANDDPHFEPLAAAYDRFLARMSDPGTGVALTAAAPRRADDLAAPPPPAYAELHANSRVLMAELLRFVLGRRGGWGDAFFEYLLF